MSSTFISANQPLTKESIYLKVADQQLHMQRFYQNADGPPLWLVHGSVENGHIFYSSSGKGLAPFLASHGFDVFVADLRGRGKSLPAVSSESKWGLKEILEEDFAAYLEKIKEIKGLQPMHWLGHSWGGVLQLAFLARHQAPVAIKSLLFFGTKRRVSIFGPGRLFMIDLIWNYFSRYLTRKYKYLPAKRFKIGSDNESKRSHRETLQWVKEKAWLDWHDKFDYRKALQDTPLPPALYLTGADDKVLGNPSDVRKLLEETGAANAKMLVIGKRNGFKHNYDHISLLTHTDAPEDHFQTVLRWLREKNFEK